WRVLLFTLRRMELRGELRGGRFIAGVGGEQFARSETVERLRRAQKEVQGSHPNGAPREPRRVVLSAADPLNLLGVLLPEKRVANLNSNRILFEDGLPTAVLEKDEVKFLRETAQEERWP